MSIFPGIKINSDKVKLNILSRLNPNNLAPIDNMKTWRRIDDEVYESDTVLNFEKYYLLYKHPIHDYLDKLFEVNRDELIFFMKERIIPDRGEGLDIIVCSKDFSELIVCNHDGEIYQA